VFDGNGNLLSKTAGGVLVQGFYGVKMGKVKKLYS
jgi:hypothetical protein